MNEVCKIAFVHFHVEDLAKHEVKLCNMKWLWLEMSMMRNVET